jgi:hypothetical protein
VGGSIAVSVRKHAEPEAKEAEPTGRALLKEVTGIVVPVPEAQAFAAHPHITLLAPFRPRERLDDDRLQDELGDFFAHRAPLDFALVAVRTFPDGHVYLAPEPDQPFRTMTLSLAARYPDCPPYEGQFEDVIPHLTIEDGAHPLVPIRSRASVAHLVHSHGTAWDVVGTFHFTG